MPKVLTDGKTKIGAYRSDDKKKIALCIEEENKVTIYGYFNTFESADKFMDKLRKLVGGNQWIVKYLRISTATEAADDICQTVSTARKLNEDYINANFDVLTATLRDGIESVKTTIRKGQK